jgi:ribosomal protein L22
MAKQPKIYRITKTHHRTNRTYEQTGTLDELIKIYRYTLEKGESWQHEKGNKKINLQPKSIKTLVKSLYNAENNAAANGYSGYSFSFDEIQPLEN